MYIRETREEYFGEKSHKEVMIRLQNDEDRNIMRTLVKTHRESQESKGCVDEASWYDKLEMLERACV